jgi:hypothetical protein
VLLLLCSLTMIVISSLQYARLWSRKAFFVKKPTCAVHEAVNVLGIIPCYTRSDSHDQQRFTRADSLAARRSSSQNLRAQLRELPMPLSWELATFDGSAAVGPYFSTHLILAFLQVWALKGGSVQCWVWAAVQLGVPVNQHAFCNLNAGQAEP